MVTYGCNSKYIDCCQIMMRQFTLFQLVFNIQRNNIHRKVMKAMKSRNWSQDEDKILMEIVTRQDQTKKVTWNEIASILTVQMKGFNKTGKQCRERWTNQLNPEVKRNPEWSPEQNQTLFQAHNRMGNKWAQISALLPGRTDNCVKNHFYSTLRKGLRKINNYIETIKRKQCIVKIFKNQILNKILLLSQGKCDQKFQFNDKAKNLSIQIKRALTQVALIVEDDEEHLELKQKLFVMISQFSRNCRKKKTKKTEYIKQSEQSHINNQSQNEFKPLSSIISENIINQQKIQNCPKNISASQNPQKPPQQKLLPRNQSAFCRYIPNQYPQNSLNSTNFLNSTNSITSHKNNKVLKKNSNNSIQSDSYSYSFNMHSNTNNNNNSSNNREDNMEENQCNQINQMLLRSLFMESLNGKLGDNSMNYSLGKNVEGVGAGNNSNMGNNEDWFRYSGTGACNGVNFFMNSLDNKEEGTSNSRLAFVPEAKVQEKGFCSGTGSGFSIFRPQVSNENFRKSQTQELKRGQINFANTSEPFSSAMPNFMNLFSQKNINQKLTSRICESQQLDKSLNLCESPLFNQFLQNHLHQTLKYKIHNPKTPQQQPQQITNLPKQSKTTPQISLYQSNEIYKNSTIRKQSINQQ